MREGEMRNAKTIIIGTVSYTHLDVYKRQTRFCIVSRSSWANTIQIFSIARPIGVEVSNFSVEDTNSTLYCWNSSIILAKSRMERLIRSSL